ncbi:MAG: site-specific integrase [Gammaproteobacteria bacterium]|nr:site-specific integrase [Gammaproteobacteria bacterium]
MRKVFKKQSTQGGIAVDEKRQRRSALTVAELLDRYLESAEFAEKQETTRRTDAGRIERHLKPLLATKVADKLSTEDVRKTFAAIKAGKTAANIKTGPRGLARVRGGEGAARMAIRLLRAAYSWAIQERILQNNPAQGVKLGADGRRDAIIESAEQYQRVFEVIQELEDNRELRREAADAIRLIALTGARRNEIAGLRWRHVDLRRGVLVLPRSEHKTGHHSGEVRTIGLPAVAQAIISRQESEEQPDGYVFPPAYGKGPITLNKPWRKIRDRAGIGDVGLHGLRHSLATHMALEGAQAAEIMAVMGHRNLSTSQKYIHFAKDIHAGPGGESREGRQRSPDRPIASEGHQGKA